MMNRYHNPSKTLVSQVSLLFFLIMVTLTLHLSKPQLPTAHADPNQQIVTERTRIVLPPLKANQNYFVASPHAGILTAELTKGADGRYALNGPVQPLITAGKASASGKENLTENFPDMVITALYPSPDGKQIAVQIDYESNTDAWLLELADPTTPVLVRLTPTGYGTFLEWHPDSRHALFQAIDQDVLDPGLWLVDTFDGSHTRIEVPELGDPQGIMAATISPDGRTIAYSFTRGLGHGSTTWLCNIDGSAPRKIRDDKMALVADLQWSPDSQRLAFVTLYDSPVPFAEAGLWVMGNQGEKQQMLALMDGGHGQSPLWSHDGQTIYFVVRDNLDDVQANRNPLALISSIWSVGVTTGKKTLIVPANGARQLDLSLTPTGEILFSSNRSGAQEIWLTNPQGNLQQISSDGVTKRHPVFLP